MSSRTRFLLPAILFLAVGLTARADEAEEVKEKLQRAKRVYDADLKDFKKAVNDLFDKREEIVRQAGDKKGLDDLKTQRKAFDDLGETPAMLPMSVKSQLATSRTTLDKAYQSSIKDHIRLKLDDAADKIEKEREAFLLASAFLAGKRTYVSSLKAFDIKVWNNRFEKDAGQYKMDGKAIPHSVFMHPDTGMVANASYAIPTKATAFRVSIGVPKHEESLTDPASPLQFEVLIDGKSVWKSEAVTKLDTFQTCAVKIEKAKTLTLRVHCPGPLNCAHCVWFSPVIIE